jgi:DGQHR domain-containing protein
MSVKQREEMRLPALEIRQGERRLYQFALDGKRLHEISTVSRIRREKEGEIAGYQRPEVLRHVKAIRTYLESPRALMPNALVIAFDSRVRFEPATEVATDADSAAGTVVIPLPATGDDPPGWVVDGQQRAAALRDAKLQSFPIPVVGFITDDLAEQRAQFILVNNTKPLPKGLIHELLPATDGALPVSLLRKRYPSKLLAALNLTPGSPMYQAIRTPTMPEGHIRDNSVLKMIENSITDGALYQYRDPRTGEGDGAKMLEVLWNFWAAVAEAWPEAWELPPRKSRLTHGVGIVALGYVMDEITESFSENGSIPSRADYISQLAPLVNVCAWTRGQWDFGLREHRPWNELQVTPKDIMKLAELLLRTYRANTLEERLQVEVANAAG